ncbi:HPr family phosphocarrier protein [Candidatus Calescamantes bacterium]|nr:HPr family phosphocarrier protein [bacterium]MCK5224078.1 HPr family phosphocarrier protein [Candidatus Calescamantes bacterium]MCK5598344.1 HPr family phosphocarrier protein [bacterium]
MNERMFTVMNQHGLHLRPATEFVKLTSVFKGEVLLVKDDIEVNAKSILGLLSLGIESGARVKIRLSGIDEEKFFEQLEEFFAKEE